MLNRRLALALIACAASAAPAFADGLRNGLPQTSMDSFVTEAGAYKEFIYGDEGVWDIPPYFGFEKVNRIGAGIFDRRDQGLTTNHGSWLPDAWGRDEFLGQEWDKSGPDGRSGQAGLAYGLPTIKDPTTNPNTGTPTTTKAPFGTPEFATPGNYRKLPKNFGQAGDAGRRDTGGANAARNSSASQTPSTAVTLPPTGAQPGAPFSTAGVVTTQDNGSGF